MRHVKLGEQWIKKNKKRSRRVLLIAGDSMPKGPYPMHSAWSRFVIKFIAGLATF